jgi:hypothetical protein
MNKIWRFQRFSRKKWKQFQWGFPFKFFLWNFQRFFVKWPKFHKTLFSTYFHFFIYNQTNLFVCLVWSILKSIKKNYEKLIIIKAGNFSFAEFFHLLLYGCIKTIFVGFSTFPDRKNATIKIKLSKLNKKYRKYRTKRYEEKNRY